MHFIRAILLAVSFALVAAFSGTGATAQTVDVSLSAPLSTTETSFEITAEWSANTSSLDDPFLDVSFPANVADVQVVESTGFESVDVFFAGDTIYNSDGEPITAQYPLASGTRPDYGGQTLSMRLRVFVNATGEIPLQYRGALGATPPVAIDPEDGNECTTDQQGWPVYCETVIADSETFPDVTVSQVEVNGGNPVASGAQVQIEAVLEEIAGETAGRVNLDYRVNGTVIDDDLTNELGPNDSDSETTTYTFPSGGTYTVEVVADPEDILAESDETNNTRSTTVAVEQSALDLSVSPSASQTLAPGASVTYQITVTDGSGPVSGASVGVEDELADASVEIDPTDNNGETVYTATVPDGTASGTYELSFQADADGYSNTGPVTRQVVVEEASGPTRPFITTWQTTSSGESITIPTSGGDPASPTTTSPSTGATARWKPSPATTRTPRTPTPRRAPTPWPSPGRFRIST